MAENTTNLPPSESGPDLPIDLDEDIFDFQGDGGNPQALPPVGARSADHNPPGEDEDLFDFQGQDDSPGSSTSADTLDVGAENLTRLVEATNPEGADEEQPAARERAQTQPGSPTASGLFGPDEDLFDFDNLRTATDDAGAGTLQHGDLVDQVKAEGPVAASPEPAAPAESTAPEVPPTPAPFAASPGPVGSPGATEAAAAQSAPALPSPMGAPLGYRRFVPEQVIEASLPAERGWDRRVVWSVAAVFLLVNLSLILVATRISQSLNSTLDGVRNDLTRSISQADTAEVPIQSTLPPLEPGRAAEIPPSGTPDPSTIPTDLANVAGRELELAHQEVASAAFPAARRRLYRLLANRDRLLISTDVLAEAEFLVAESYFQEAKNRDSVLSGGQR